MAIVCLELSFLLLKDKVKRPIKEILAACLRLERCSWGPQKHACLNEQAKMSLLITDNFTLSVEILIPYVTKQSF